MSVGRGLKTLEDRDRGNYNPTFSGDAYYLVLFDICFFFKNINKTANISTLSEVYVQ